MSRPKSAKAVGTAVTSFNATRENELQLSVGDVVVVKCGDLHHKWLAGYIQGDKRRRGIFPQRCVEFRLHDPLSNTALQVPSSPQKQRKRSRPQTPPRPDNPGREVQGKAQLLAHARLESGTSASHLRAVDTEASTPSPGSSPGGNQGAIGAAQEQVGVEPGVEYDWNFFEGILAQQHNLTNHADSSRLLSRQQVAMIIAQSDKVTKASQDRRRAAIAENKAALEIRDAEARRAAACPPSALVRPPKPSLPQEMKEWRRHIKEIEVQEQIRLARYGTAGGDLSQAKNSKQAHEVGSCGAKLACCSNLERGLCQCYQLEGRMPQSRLIDWRNWCYGLAVLIVCAALSLFGWCAQSTNCSV